MQALPPHPRPLFLKERGEGAALLFACTFPTVMAWAYFVALAPSVGDQPLPEPSAALRVAYFAGKFVQFGFPIVYLALVEPNRLRPRPPRLQGWLLGLTFYQWAALVLATALAGQWAWESSQFAGKQRNKGVRNRF